MSHSYWRFIAAVGFLILTCGFSGQQRADQKRQETHSSRSQAAATVPAENGAADRSETYAPSCDQPKNREDASFCIERRSVLAAEKANFLSEKIFWPTVGGIFVGALSALFAGWAAREASRAAVAAEKSLSHADEVMRNDLRAYVSVSHVNINWTDKGAEAVLTVVNCGSTPATYFTVMGEIEYLPLTADALIKDDYAEKTTWSPLAANDDTTAPLRQEGIFLTGLSRTQDNYLSVRGVIAYGTIFKEECTSQFSFMLKYRPDKLQKMQVNTGRLDVFRVVSREEA